MKNNARVSVVVPTYNCGKYLQEALDSILAQTISAYEIIIVDDGSTDNTKIIVSQYKAESIKYFYQENAGVSAARNFGMSIASGTHLAFLDADDRWRETMLAEQLQAFSACPELVFSFTNFIRFAQDLENKPNKDIAQIPNHVYLDQFQFYPELTKLKVKPISDSITLIDEDAFCSLVSFGEVPAYTSCIMFKPKRIRELEFNKNLKICEDTEFVLRTSTRGKVAFNNKILFEMRRHGENATSDTSNMAFDKLTVFLNLLKHNELDRNQKLYLNARIVRSYFDAMNTALKKRELKKSASLFLRACRIQGSLFRKVKTILKLPYLIIRHMV